MLEIQVCTIFSLKMHRINEIDNKFLLNKINQVTDLFRIMKSLLQDKYLLGSYTPICYSSPRCGTYNIGSNLDHFLLTIT